MTSGRGEESPEVLRDRVALIRPFTNGAGLTLVPGTLGTLQSAPGSSPRARFIGDLDCDLPADTFAHLLIDGALPASDELSILFASVVGSRAHGLGLDSSDVDRRGFYVAGASVHFSLAGPPAQLVHDADQLCFWEVEKFLRLALKANPTVLEALYSPMVEIAAPFIRDRLADFKRRGVFLSQRAHQTFMGYADAQFEKMTRSFAQTGGVKWQHAMHLIRLLRVGIRLVQSGELSVLVPPAQRDELLAIKRGERDWAEVAALRAALVAEFQEAASKSALPAEPPEQQVDAFLVDLRLAVAGAAFS